MKMLSPSFPHRSVIHPFQAHRISHDIHLTSAHGHARLYQPAGPTIAYTYLFLSYSFDDTHARIDNLRTRAHWTVTTHAPMPHVFTMGLDII